MPELAEVENWRLLAEEQVLEKQIASVWTAKDPIIFDQTKPATFARKLKGRRVIGAERWGKHLWLRLDTGPHPYFHFGMSGSFEVYREISERPRFLKCELAFTDGTRLGYRNIRRLGRVRLLNDPMNEEPMSRMGFDPWIALPDFAEFKTKLIKRKAPVKAVLLDQKFAAGVGNWLADDILFQAKIDPRRKACDLSDAEVRRVRNKMKSIVAKAVAVRADETKFPRSWLFHYRWGKTQSQTAKGQQIEFITVGGRTTAWVPDEQH